MAMTPGAQRSSPLSNINVKMFPVSGSPGSMVSTPGGINLDADTRALTSTEAAQIMVDGILYTPTVHHSIVAPEPDTWKEVWKYDLGKWRLRYAALHAGRATRKALRKFWLEPATGT